MHSDQRSGRLSIVTNELAEKINNAVWWSQINVGSTYDDVSRNLQVFAAQNIAMGINQLFHQID